MTSGEPGQWLPDYEDATAFISAYDKSLERLTLERRNEGELFAAGVLAFEHADLLSMLRRSPDARRAAGFAILLAQKDMELAASALDMVMEDVPFYPHIHISEAKAVLKNAIDERGWAPRPLIRQLGLAYLGDAPSQLSNKYKEYKRYSHGGLASPYIRKIWTRKAILSTENGSVTVELDIVKDFDQSWLFYERNANGEAEEVFSVFDGNTFHERINFGSGSDRKAMVMAERLLSLPDEPIYIDSTKPVAPVISATEARLAALDAEEQRWLEIQKKNDGHLSKMIMESLSEIRSEKAKLLQ